MNWNGIKYFLAVARHGGLSAAADSINSNPATISRHISSLEKELAVTLFIKHARGYNLTASGQVLFDRLVQFDLTLENLADIDPSNTVQGEVKLACPESVANYLLLPKFSDWQRDYPMLRFDLTVTREQTDLAKREADVALRIVKAHQRDFAADCVAFRLGDFEFGLFVHRRYFSEGMDWKRLPYTSLDSKWTKLPMVEWLRDVFPGRDPTIRTNSMQAQIEAIKAAGVIAMLPAFIAEREPDLCRVDVDLHHTRHELWMFYHSNMRANARISATCDLIRQTCSPSLINCVS